MSSYPLAALTIRAPEQPDTLGTFARLMQMKEMLQQRRLNELAMQRESLALAELQRKEKEGQIMRHALAAGVRQTPVYDLSGQYSASPDTPLRQRIDYQPSATLAKLQELAPDMVPGYMAEQEAQQRKQQQEQVALGKALAEMDAAQLGNIKTRTDLMGSLAQSVIANPASYPSAKQQAERMGLVQPGQLPEQLTPEMMPQLQQIAAQAQSVKDMITQEEIKRHNLAMEANAAKPVPGVDVPLPEDVEAQRARMAQAATKPEPGSYIPLTDELGRVVGAWNPKSKQVEKVPDELAGARRSGLPGTELSRRALLTGMSEDMARVAELAENFKGTATIGFGTGAVGSLKRRIIGGDTNAIDMERMLNNAADILLRARSGAQINEQEYIRLRRLIPSLNESEDTFFTKLKGFREELERMVKQTTSPPGAGAPKASAAPPPGATMIVPGSDGKMHWSDGKADLGVAE